MDLFVRAYLAVSVLAALFVVGIIIYAATQGLYAPLIIFSVLGALSSPLFVAMYRLRP